MVLESTRDQLHVLGATNALHLSVVRRRLALVNRSQADPKQIVIHSLKVDMSQDMSQVTP